MTTTNPLMQFRDTIDVYCENHIEHINTLCGQVLMLKQMADIATLWPHSFTHGAEPLPIVQPFKKFPAFYGSRRLITVFTRALH
jgi:hypothetical protein